MPNDRLIKLLELKETIPNDPFLDYAMALEYVKLDDVEKAASLFSMLYQDYPDYLPFYYHYGALLMNTNRGEQSEEVLQKGVLLAKSQNDMRTLAELEGLLVIIEDL